MSIRAHITQICRSEASSDIAKLYEKYIEQYELNIYSEKLEKIPTPKYFVLYNGTRDMPERMELKLSDAFMHPDESSGIEFTAIMININYGMNKELMAACSTLEGVCYIHRPGTPLRRPEHECGGNGESC